MAVQHHPQEPHLHRLKPKLPDTCSRNQVGEYDLTYSDDNADWTLCDSPSWSISSEWQGAMLGERKQVLQGGFQTKFTVCSGMHQHDF